MKVFLAGGSGAIGKQLIPQLTAKGHDVTATTRSESNAALLREFGAEPVIVDGLDRDGVMKAVMLAEPDVVIHQLTAIPSHVDIKHFDRSFAQTNRLRTEGTDHLLAAALAAGAKRFIAQSYCAWPYERTGSTVKTEEAPFDEHPPAEQSESLKAIKHVEQAVLSAQGIEGIVLRYGAFYGPGTGNEMAELVAKRKFPVIGDGGGVWSFIHIADAASATVAAIDHGAPGVYNIADDEPVRVAEWLPALAKAVGAKPPWRVPVWLGRIAAGEVGVSMMTQIRGASNAKAKRELAWTPRYPTYREGFADGLR
jgi:2-alkyl-3-oxoalkanoate reductase